MVSTANHKTQTQKQFSCPKWITWRDAFHDCLLEKYTSVTTNLLRERFVSLWQECMNLRNISDVDKYFRLKSYRNNHEAKIVARNADGYEYVSCTFITLGIGTDVKAELAFREENSNCTFYGADPTVVKNRELYSSFGKYFQIAVGATNGSINARVLEKGKYIPQVLQAVDIVTFVLSHVNHTVIDHLWMDIEGPEYDILPLLVNGGMLERKNITICQLNIELHGPLQRFGSTRKKFGEMINNFTKNSKFTMLSNIYVPRILHHRTFFLNGVDPYCIHRYLGHLCD